MSRDIDIDDQPVDLAAITAHDHAREKQKENRKVSLKRGRGSRLQHKGKARTSEKPWGGRRAR